MKTLLAIFTVFILAGCTSSTTEQIKTVTSQYDAITYRDGIDEQEAFIIGKREVIKKNFLKFYDIENPTIMRDVTDLPNHEKYWFVRFREKKVANIEMVFIAVINRDNGKVRYSDDIQEDKRWILEAVLLGG